MTPSQRKLSKTVGLGVAALAAAPAADAATFNVTNLSDSGAGSLRQAVLDANAAAGADVITFQAGLSGTISLTSDQLSLYESVDIQGPGAGVITVDGNDAVRVFYMYSPSPTPFDVTISGLTITRGADAIGGGIVSYEENLTLDGVTITDSNAFFGAGLFLAGSDAGLTIRNTTITGNTATFFGGGIYVLDANVLIEGDTIISDNDAQDGAGLFADGFTLDLTIRDTTISGNIAAGRGGGVYIEDTGAPLLIENSEITGNEAATNGGGIYFYDSDDTITIRDTTVSGNTAGVFGGGISFYYTYAGVRIERSTISGNSAQFGGGIDLYYNVGSFEIVNSTISGNEASLGGGGISAYYLYAPMTLNFATVANNTALVAGGGMFVEIGVTEINNSIIADNTAPTDRDLGDGTSASFELSFSLVESTTGANIVDLGANLLGVDPQLGALADNGGPTFTHRPGLMSPVINAADPAPPAEPTDQRGLAREIAGRADMGAVEINGCTLQFDPDAYTIAENAGTVTLIVTRTDSVDPATVDFATFAGSASAGNDFLMTGGTLTFGVGVLSQTFDVPILDDALAEGPESFTVTLSNPSPGAVLGSATTATVTITDFGPGSVQFSVSQIDTTEDAGTVTITVTRTGESNGPITVNHATADGTATAPQDYAMTAGSVVFGDGDTAPKTFTIPLIDDTVPEGQEMFTVNITGASAGTIGSPSSLTVVIEQSDVEAIPTLSFFGKILFGLMGAIAGFYAIVRNRLSMMLFALLVAGLVAAPPLEAQTRPGRQGKETKTGKIVGTVQSVTNDGTSLVLTLVGGATIAVPVRMAEVIDNRGSDRKKGTLQQVVAGTRIVVKMHSDKSGNVKRVKIKIKS